MCGICGIVSRDPKAPIDGARLTAMRDILAHRGPDDAGNFLEPGVGLAARRLCVLDLSERGHMPMASRDERFWIVHNGEIYNYRELRATLEARGYVFHSNTDTEVLLYLYAEEGPRMLDRLNGMFAFAVWDRRERRLFIARDRLGIKPLYYAVWGDSFYFASEEKALFEAGIPKRFDAGKWEELLCFRYVAGEETPFVQVKKLLPGHSLVWKEGGLEIRRWWHLGERAKSLAARPPSDPGAWLRDTLDDAVRIRRIGDVPLGVLLSGGLDSGSVAASLASSAGTGVRGFTVRFSEPDYDEGALAREVAERHGLTPHELEVNPAELWDRLQRASWLADEPLAHGSDLHLAAISQYAKPHVTVLLSGEGGDETLGGYVRYRPLHYSASLPILRVLLAPLASMLPAGGRLRKLARFLGLGSLERFLLYNTCDVLPEDLRALGMNPGGAFPYREEILLESRRFYPGDFVRQAMYSDQHTFLGSLLHRNDRMTMGASIECRVPFLDYRLVEGLAAMPSSTLFSGAGIKPLLRRAVGDRLPASVLRNRKWGFGVPWPRYLGTFAPFRELLEDLQNRELIRRAPFGGDHIKKVVKAFLKGDGRWNALVTGLVMLTVWHESYFAAGAKTGFQPAAFRTGS